MNSRPLSCAKVSALRRPVGREQAGAFGSNGGNTTGLVMPGGPSCAIPVSAIAVDNAIMTARTRRLRLEPSFLTLFLVIRFCPGTERQGAQRCRDDARYIPLRRRWFAPSH